MFIIQCNYGGFVVTNKDLDKWNIWELCSKLANATKFDKQSAEYFIFKRNDLLKDGIEFTIEKY